MNRVFFLSKKLLAVIFIFGVSYGMLQSARVKHECKIGDVIEDLFVLIKNECNALKHESLEEFFKAEKHFNVVFNKHRIYYKNLIKYEYDKSGRPLERMSLSERSASMKDSFTLDQEFMKSQKLLNDWFKKIGVYVVIKAMIDPNFKENKKLNFTYHVKIHKKITNILTETIFYEWDNRICVAFPERFNDTSVINKEIKKWFDKKSIDMYEKKYVCYESDRIKYHIDLLSPAMSCS